MYFSCSPIHTHPICVETFTIARISPTDHLLARKRGIGRVVSVLVLAGAFYFPAIHLHVELEASARTICRANNPDRELKS
jgi:hypothetical protein